MRRLPLPLFVLTLLTSYSQSQADDTLQPVGVESPQAYISHPHPEVAVNGFDQYRREADIGAPGSAGYGFKHFALPFHNFTLWHRPRAATLTRWQRCAPEKFRPRGFGDLFARPCDSFRMEYSPYTTQERGSKYGPSYLLRADDPRCPKCGAHCAVDH